MKIEYSFDRALKQVSGNEKSEMLKVSNRPNKEQPNDILNFEHYFDGYTLTEGFHGPELDNSIVYISVYHFMEYQGIVPASYDTEGIGLHLSTIKTAIKFCRYKELPYKINKYDYTFIKEHQAIFDNYVN